MAGITKQLAQAIARKLGAQINKRTKGHEIAEIYLNDKLIASFGIRRGSLKDLPHNHIPEAIHLTPRQARALGQCPMSAREWVKLLSEKGKLD